MCQGWPRLQDLAIATDILKGAFLEVLYVLGAWVDLY